MPPPRLLSTFLRFTELRRLLAVATRNSSTAISSPVAPVRGTKDRYGAEATRQRWITDKALNVAGLHGYQEDSHGKSAFDLDTKNDRNSHSNIALGTAQQISTPILEHAGIFERSLGADTDVVGKELYTFLDKGGKNLTLRPEGTAGIARAFVTNGCSIGDLPLRLFYRGPMFRRERPQQGRLRQFEQVGVEYLGASSALTDAECVSLAWEFLKALGLQADVQLEINTLGDSESRKSYRSALYEHFSKHNLGEQSQVRLQTNPLRILDSKDPQDKDAIASAPQILDSLSPSSKARFNQVCNLLEAMNVSYKINPRLVRGLDYYTGVVWEFTAAGEAGGDESVRTNEGRTRSAAEKLGKSQGTVLAGGRYDDLIKELGGPHREGVHGIGWAAGVERLNLLLPTDHAPSTLRSAIPLIILHPKPAATELETANTERSVFSHGFRLATRLRESGIPISIHSDSNWRKFKKLYSAPNLFVLIVGEHETKGGVVCLRDNVKDTQSLLDADSVVDILRGSETA